jgi:acetyltransferase-like isoleucine patch superfamily enzyme
MFFTRYPVGYIYSRFLKKMRGYAAMNSVVHKTSKVQAGTTLINSRFDKHSFCGYDCNILNCEIGSFCSIASDVVIGGMRHPAEYVSTSPAFLSHRDSIKAKFAHHHYFPQIRTTIGHDVWIGDGALLKAGISVGDGAVIGMGAVVTKDVAPYAIVGGSPARLIRMRFEPEIVDGLLKLKWWTLSEAELRRLGPHFTNPRALLIHLGLL